MFDAVVRDHESFELFWGWPNRFEAYTPAPKRLHGSYTPPVLRRDPVIEWENVSVRSDIFHADVALITSRAAREISFRIALEDKPERIRMIVVCLLSIDGWRAGVGVVRTDPASA